MADLPAAGREAGLGQVADGFALLASRAPTVTRPAGPGDGPQPAADVARTAGVVALGAMIAAQVASADAEETVLFVWLIIVLLTAASVSFAASRAGWRRAVAGAAAAVLLGQAAEWVGVRTGYPFGTYHYTGRLRPSLGQVPVVVPLAWAGMGLPAYAVGCALARHRWRRIAAGALALTVWDLFLDPQMLRNGFWTWARPGSYRGVPLSNFGGWLLVSGAAMTVFDRILGGLCGGRGLLATYSVMAVMETAGFAAVFDPDPLVALAGGVGMGVPAAAAWLRRRTRSREARRPAGCVRPAAVAGSASGRLRGMLSSRGLRGRGSG